MYSDIAEKVSIYKEIIEKQYNFVIDRIKFIDVYSLNDPLFNYDGKHIYLFFGQLIPNKLTTNIVKVEFNNLAGNVFDFYSDFSTTENNNLSNVNVLFNKAIDNSDTILNGLVIEYTIF